MGCSISELFCRVASGISLLCSGAANQGILGGFEVFLFACFQGITAVFWGVPGQFWRVSGHQGSESGQFCCHLVQFWFIS